VRLAELVRQDMIPVCWGPTNVSQSWDRPPVSSTVRSRARLPISPGIAASAVDVPTGSLIGIDPDKLRTLVGSAHAALSQKAPNVIGLFVVGTL
jgi:hypothetical protein